ncbi:MAG: hypothetical protein ACM3MK_11690 [Chitinophagales bacterium]
MQYDIERLAGYLVLAKGSRSINKYGTETGVDPGYISRLMRGLIKTPPSASVLKRLAEKAYNGVSSLDLMVAAGYLETEENNSLFITPENQKAEYNREWAKVIEEAARYNISPDQAMFLIKSLVKSLEDVGRENA